VPGQKSQLQNKEILVKNHEVIGPEIALLLNATPNATDRVQLWVYLHQ
jgi:hypothetical protein